MSIGYCPRCGERSYELLRTHSFCINCNYYPEEFAPEPPNTQELLTAEDRESLAKWARRLDAVM